MEVGLTYALSLKHWLYPCRLPPVYHDWITMRDFCSKTRVFGGDIAKVLRKIDAPDRSHSVALHMALNKYNYDYNDDYYYVCDAYADAI